MTLIDKAEAHDDDLIRRGDADAAIVACKGNGATRQNCRDAIAAIPARGVGADAVLDAAHAYLVQQYGHSALAHPIDRARILAALELPTSLQKVQNAPLDDREAFLEWLDSLPKEPNDTLKAAYAAYKAAVRPAPVDALVKAAEAVAEDACSYICPSTGKAGEPISHDPRCVALRAALRKDHEQRE